MTKYNTSLFSQPIDASHMRWVNRSAILELVRQNSPIARSQISRTLGLSMPTVMRIVEELIKEDLIRTTGETESSSGRPRELLEYHANGYAVIGIDLGGTNMYGALANIGGQILGEADKHQHNSSGETSYQLLTELIQTLLNLPRQYGQRILGIAVGAPGVTHFNKGVVEWAPSLNWREFGLKQRLEESFQLPIFVENDVNLAALGEQWFGAGKGVKNMVLITIGTGVGAGLIIDGAIYRGHTEAAGEIGYFVPNRESLGKKYSGFGAMESIISGTGVAERARHLLNGKASIENLKSLTSLDVFNAARQDQDWALQVVDETADYLSIAIANISTLLDPELIVLGGGVANSADLLISRIIQKIEGVIPRTPSIKASTLGSRATVMGAIALTVHAVKDYYVVRRLY